MNLILAAGQSYKDWKRISPYLYNNFVRMPTSVGAGRAENQGLHACYSDPGGGEGKEQR